MSSTVAGKEVFRQPTYARKEAEEILVVLHYGTVRGRALDEDSRWRALVNTDEFTGCIQRS